MKVMKDKVRKKKVNWVQELELLGDRELNSEFVGMLHRLTNKNITRKRCKYMSINRVAYYVLSRKYSTTSTAALMEKLHGM